MQESICSFDLCGRPVKAKGLCASHHRQQLRGKPLTAIPEGFYTWDSSWESLRQKIEHYLDKNDPSGCWIWTRTKSNGYGHVRWGGKMRSVHRAYLAELGYRIPDGLVIDHLCRNHSCANPDHLEIVTDRENILRGVGRAAENAAKTLCIRGHEFTETEKRGRFCRECDNYRQRRAYARKKANASDTPDRSTNGANG